MTEYENGYRAGVKNGYCRGYKDGLEAVHKHCGWKMISHSETEPVADYQCTNCGGILEDVPDFAKDKLPNFCPVCGAQNKAAAINPKITTATEAALEKIGQKAAYSSLIQLICGSQNDGGV